MAKPTIQQSMTLRALDNIAIGFRNEAYIWRDVAPPRPVDRIAGRYWVYDPSSFFRSMSKPRSPLGEHNQADYSLTSASYNCVTYDIAHRVSDLLRSNSDNVLAPDITAAEFVADQLDLGVEIRVAAVLAASANWASSGSATSLTGVWTNPNSNPVTDMFKIKSVVRRLIGREPNTVVMSSSTRDTLLDHPDIIERWAPTRTTSVTDAFLADLFKVPNFLVGAAIQDTSLEGAAATRADIWGRDVWVGYVDRTTQSRVPTAVMVLEHEAKRVDRFRIDRLYLDEFVGMHTVAEIVSASEAGYLLMSAI